MPVMRMPLPRVVSGHPLDRRGSRLALALGTAVLLELAAGTGLAYLAGFTAVRAVLLRFNPVWLAVLAGALLVSFVGYFFAYLGVFRVENGPPLSGRQMLAVVAAGFGGILAHNGARLERDALRAAGEDEAQARIRVTGLAGMEHGVLAICACGMAIAVLVTGAGTPPTDFTLPWAIIPVPGFLLAFWAAERYRGRFRDRPGWRGFLGMFLDSVHIVRELFLRPHRWGSAVLGMAVFWAAEALAAWAGLAAFGVKMGAAALFTGFATGMVFTRRTGPFAGAGVLALVMPLTIWASGAPFAVAIVGVFSYRFLALWLPMPASLAVLPLLREMAGSRPRAAPRQAQDA